MEKLCWVNFENFSKMLQKWDAFCSNVWYATKRVDEEESS